MPDPDFTREYGNGRKEYDHNFDFLAAQDIIISVDLIGAAKRQLSFLRAVHCVPGLHRGPAVALAIKRYFMFWMPLAAERFQKLKKEAWEGSKALLPPFDIQWVWHCHRLHPIAYRNYCNRMFKEVIDYPILIDSEDEAFARDRCRGIWTRRYPKEPFDIVPHIHRLASGQVYSIHEQSEEEDDNEEQELVSVIGRQSSFYTQVSQPYMWNEQFLHVALQRYKCFLHLLRKKQGKVLVPTYDIDLMWHSHQLSPLAYLNDTQRLFGCVMDHDDTLPKGANSPLDQGLRVTALIWENTFGQAYEKAGCMYRGTQPLSPTPISDGGGFERVPLALPWSYKPKDVNKDLTCLSARFVVEVCILIKRAIGNGTLKDHNDLFLRLKTLGSQKFMKLETRLPVSVNGDQPRWQKVWLFQCEMSTKGVSLELRRLRQRYFEPMTTRKGLGQIVFTWKQLQEMPMLSVDAIFPPKDKRRQLLHNNFVMSQDTFLKVGASITPSVPAPYLLKSIPDRVTDDQGVMISSLYLRLRRNKPQEGRWLSRTVLDHKGNECFVIRIRAARGVWRKGKDRPVGVDWNERVIHICEGGWNFKFGNVGTAPAHVVATAHPFADDLGQYKVRWSFSSGETLTVWRPLEELDWERKLEFVLDGSSYGFVRLLNGRRLAYQVPGATAEDEEGFVTLVRHTSDAPQGKATALFSWKLSVMEVHPEESLLLVLLLCTSILRSVADLGGVSYENLSKRRSSRETNERSEEWGSLVLEDPGFDVGGRLWYVNPETVASLPAAHEVGAKNTLSRVSYSCQNCNSEVGGVDWEEGKSFVEEQSRHAGFGGELLGEEIDKLGAAHSLKDLSENIDFRPM